MAENCQFMNFFSGGGEQVLNNESRVVSIEDRVSPIEATTLHFLLSWLGLQIPTHSCFRTKVVLPQQTFFHFSLRLLIVGTI